MNLIALTQLVSTGEAKELELLSLEGGFYLLRALTDAGPVTLSDAHGQPVRLRSTTELRQLLAVEWMRCVQIRRTPLPTPVGNQLCLALIKCLSTCDALRQRSSKVRRMC